MAGPPSVAAAQMLRRTGQARGGAGVWSASAFRDARRRWRFMRGDPSSVAFGDISHSSGEMGAHISIIDLFTRPMIVIAPSNSGGGISRYDAGWKGGVSFGR